MEKIGKGVLHFATPPLKFEIQPCAGQNERDCRKSVPLC